jgi:hypothetical protein
MLAGVMFPLWPPIMRLGVWYLSIAVLGLVGLFFAIAIVRLIFYIITVIVASPGIWIFPELFADVGFVCVLMLLTHILRTQSLTWVLSTGRVLYPPLGMGSPQEKGQEVEALR